MNAVAVRKKLQVCVTQAVEASAALAGGTDPFASDDRVALARKVVWARRRLKTVFDRICTTGETHRALVEAREALYGRDWLVKVRARYEDPAALHYVAKHITPGAVIVVHAHTLDELLTAIDLVRVEVPA